MKAYTIPTASRQNVVLTFGLYFSRPSTVRILGYDKQRPETWYFNRDENFPIGYHKIEIPMPVTPKELGIEFFETYLNSNSFEVQTVSADWLQTPDAESLDSDVRSYLEFIKWFAKNASYLPCKTYRDGKHVIHYEPEIVDQEQGVLTTPARMDHISKDQWFAKKYIANYTVPMIVMIGLHEFMHGKLNTKNESEADINAGTVYLANGFPKSEGLYAFTKIFRDSPETIERTNIMTNFFNQWN